MKKIKVLHIIPTFSSGGAERVLLGYMKDFNNDPEFELHTLALGENGGSIFDKEIELSNLNIKYAGIGAGKFLSGIRRMIAIRHEIKRLKPDIVHSHLRLTSYVRFASLFISKKKRTSLDVLFFFLYV